MKKLKQRIKGLEQEFINNSNNFINNNYNNFRKESTRKVINLLIQKKYSTELNDRINNIKKDIYELETLISIENTSINTNNDLIYCMKEDINNG